MCGNVDRCYAFHIHIYIYANIYGCVHGEYPVNRRSRAKKLCFGDISSSAFAISFLERARDTVYISELRVR